MPIPSVTASALKKAGVEILVDLPLRKRVWWRAGGLADGWASVHTLEECRRIIRIASDTGCPVFPIGNGSNLLVADAGVRGLIVHLGGELASAEQVAPDQVRLGAGLKLMVLQNRVQREGWTGLECFAGIPGTVGGAVRMNAGSRLGEVVDNLISVDVVLANGERERLEAADLRLSYRSSELPEGAIVIAAQMALTGENPEAQQGRVREFLDRRKATQPLDQPSCGSTFRNPPGDHAGRLIEAAGLKGFTVGGAQVSPKHANFIVNTGGASATDIRQVIETVEREVFAQHGVRLHREVHYVGDWEGWDAVSA
jgi:UDP-N-acetylmuramate dehydrogenase